MVKVKTSQIPEKSGKPQFQKRKKMKTTSKKSKEWDEDDEEEDDETQRLKKTMIDFQEEGIIISSWDLHTIEKDMRFVEKPKAHWEFGITLNKGLTPNQFITKTDLSLWYNTEEVRDNKWDKLVEILKIEGLNVIEI
jgi:hypothetical protein